MMASFLRSDKPPARVALVIGNSAYASVAALPNAGRDAILIGEELTSLGIEVHAHQDLDKAGMDSAIAEFSGRLAEIGMVDTVIFYFSGHGYQENGVNYLLPVDGVGDTIDSIELQREIDKLSDKSRRRLIFLDACRSSLDTEQVEETAMRSRSVPAGQRLDIKSGLADFDVVDDTFISCLTSAPMGPNRAV